MSNKYAYIEFLKDHERLQNSLGLSHDEHRILVYLLETTRLGRTLCQADLVKLGRFGTAPKLMIHLKKLINTNLVSKKVGEDKRSFELILTDLGNEYIESLGALMSKAAVKSIINFKPVVEYPHLR